MHHLTECLSAVIHPDRPLFSGRIHCSYLGSYLYDRRGDSILMDSPSITGEISIPDCKIDFRFLILRQVVMAHGAVLSRRIVISLPLPRYLASTVSTQARAFRIWLTFIADMSRLVSLSDVVRCPSEPIRSIANITGFPRV